MNPIYKVNEWGDENFDETNNFLNFSYKDLNQIKFKSKKLTKNVAKDKIFFVSAILPV